MSKPGYESLNRLCFSPPAVTFTAWTWEVGMDWFQILAAVVAVAIGLSILAAAVGGVVFIVAYRRVSKAMAEREANRTYRDRLRRKYGL